MYVCFLEKKIFKNIENYNLLTSHGVNHKINLPENDTALELPINLVRTSNEMFVRFGGF